VRRALVTWTLLAAAAACAQPEPARAWPAEHPLRAEVRDEASTALPSLAPQFDLPERQEVGEHGEHGGHGAHGHHGAHAGHGKEREVLP
jgi:hypothetical protein